MRLVAVIPARGGSKSIPGKNIADCAGRPLLAWTCAAALASRSLGRVLLSTDAQGIAAVGRSCGVEVPFLRPALLAADDTPAAPVLQHALEWLDDAGDRPDALVLLQPTSPLRRAEHIDAAVRLFQAGGADTVVSVVEVPHRYHPDSAVIERDGLLYPYRGQETVTRRQDQAPLLARNGPAVLIVSRTMVRHGKLYGGRTVGFRMGAHDSIDVDTPEDLALAALLLRARGAHP